MTRRGRGDKAKLVVRRGQEFYLHLSLSRDYNYSIDGISIVFTLDGIEKPQYGHGTLVATALLNPGEISEAAWQATIAAIEPNFLRIKASRESLFNTLLVAHANPDANTEELFDSKLDRDSLVAIVLLANVEIYA